MRVLVFEPQYVGHNLAYLVHLLARLHAMGCEAHVATSRQAMHSEQFEKHLGEHRHKFKVLPLDGFRDRPGARGIGVNGPAGCFRLMSGLLQAMREVEPQHVYVPFGNPLAHWFGFPNPVANYLQKKHVEAELVLLFGRYARRHRGWRSYLKERIALTMLQRGPWQRIHHILPHAVQVMSAHSPALASKVRLLPDPVENPPHLAKDRARQLLGIPCQGRYITLIGLIERRKGVHELLVAFKRALPWLHENDRVLLAGKATDEVRHWLQGEFSDLVAERRIISLDRHLSSDELHAACFAGNLMCTPYPDHRYSASIVIRAAAAGVPVLANAIGWMDDTVKQFGLGTTCNTNDGQCFAKQLVDALDDAHRFQLSQAARRFVTFHSTDNFAFHLTERLAERMSLSTRSDASMDWNEVLSPTPLLANSAAA